MSKVENMFNDIQNELENFLYEGKDAIEVLKNIERENISTGLDRMDAHTNGGLMAGTITQFVGNAGSGKTSFMGNFMGHFKRLYENKCFCDFIDNENTTDIRRFKDLGVENPPEPKTLTLDSINKMITKLSEFKVKKGLEEIPTLIIWDSLAATVTDKHYKEDDFNKLIGYRANMLSNYLPKIINRCNKYNITILMINQMRENLGQSMSGPYGPQPSMKNMGQHESIPGGRALEHFTAQLFKFQQKTAITPDDSTYFDFKGFKCRIKLIKNKRKSSNVSFDVIFNEQYGFSNFWTNVEMMKEHKIIKPGAWWKFPGYEGSIRSNEILDKYKSDSEFKANFKRLLEEALKVESNLNTGEGREFKLNDKDIEKIVDKKPEPEKADIEKAEKIQNEDLLK